MVNTLLGNQNYYASFNEPTVREDLHDEIINVTPLVTTKWLVCPRGEVPGNRKIEWPHDNTAKNELLTAAQLAAEVRYEGQDWNSFPTTVPRKRLFNFLEIQGDQIDVSRTMLKVDVAGSTNEFDYQGNKTFKSLAFTAEKHLSFGIGDAGETVQADPPVDTNKRKTHGIYSTIAYTGLTRAHSDRDGKIDYGGGSSLTLERSRNLLSWFYDFNLTTPGTQVTIDQVTDQVIGPAVRAGFQAQNSLCLTSLKGMQIVTGWATAMGSAQDAINQRIIPAELDTISWRITVVRTPAGTFFVAHDQQLDPDDQTLTVTYNEADIATGGTAGPGNRTIRRNAMMFWLQPSYWPIKVLDGFHYRNIAYVSDGMKGSIVSEWGLIFLSPAGGGCGMGNFWK